MVLILIASVVQPPRQPIGVHTQSTCMDGSRRDSTVLEYMYDTPIGCRRGHAWGVVHAWGGTCTSYSIRQTGWSPYLLVESVRKVNQDDLLEHNHAKGANTSEPNIAVVVDDAVGYPDGGDQEPDVRDHLDIPAMVVDGWHEAREHRHEREEARRGEAHALGGGVLAAAWVARRRVLAAVRPCILRAGYVGHVVVVPILTADGHEEREHHLVRVRVRACVRAVGQSVHARCMWVGRGAQIRR
mmetsp:Transcript_6009/g.14591  ORF Transcript_6009/g.14591 Transcript_6009/m.14591 type:complete len:242 (-) Transcript_6009:147-872(-)